MADNWLLATPGATSTFDVLANDAKPLAGHEFTITAVSEQATARLPLRPMEKRFAIRRVTHRPVSIVLRIR